MSGPPFEPQAETVGIVFPVYYSDAPIIVKDFAKRLRNLTNRYVFVVATYGGGLGDSITTISKLIAQAGGKLSAAFGVHMPQNAFRKPWAKHEKIYGHAAEKCAVISKRVLLQKPGMFLSDILVYLVLTPFRILFRPIYKSSFRKKLNVSTSTTIEELIHIADRTYSTSNSCDACGICVKVCPVQNIQIVERKPLWKGHCENCLACYDWCPKKAILGGIAQKGYFYKHPDVTVKEMTY